MGLRSVSGFKIKSRSTIPGWGRVSLGRSSTSIDTEDGSL